MDPLFDFTGKVALVTGGSRGLGYQMVRAFAERGADVVIASRKLENCEAVAEEMRALKLEHLGIDEATDVLSFPLDGRDPLPEGVPRALGDVVLCPEVVGEEWRAPLVHGLLHLLGYDHGHEMERREQEHAER